MDHVLLYIHDYRSSGVVRNALAYAHRLAQDRPTTLVSGYGQGHFCDAAGQAPFRSVSLAPAPGPWPRAAAALRLRRWLASQPGGLLLSAGNMGHPTCYWATRGDARFRRVYRISNAIERGDGLKGLSRRMWMTMLAGDAARIVLVGDANNHVEPFASALARGRAIAIANGVDRAAALQAAAAPCPHPWLVEGVPTVLAIGRLRPQKNFDRLIEAVARARPARRLRLIILGGGPEDERRRLAAAGDAAGLGEDLLLAGETDNVFAWLARADAFALPSLWEGSSMALLEALAVGVPVVAARQAGDAEGVLAGGRCGLLVDGRDVESLADALLMQTSRDAIRPGDRADCYPPSADAYARLVQDLLTDRRQAPRKALALGR